MRDKNKELIERLENLLREGGFKRVFHIDPTRQSVMPQQANFSGTDRLAVPLSGCHRMKVPGIDGVEQIKPVRHNATFMPKGCWNRPDWVNPVDVVTFSFEPDEFYFNYVECPGQGLVERGITRGRAKWSSTDGPAVLEMLRKVCVRTSNDIRVNYLAAALAGYCLDALKRGNIVRHGKAHATYTDICAYLEECCASDLSREQVASEFNISANYLSNLFKSQSGTSFNSHINHTNN